MRLDSLMKHFEAIGARVKFRKLDRRRFWWGRSPTFTIDVARDRRGPFFDFALTETPPDFELLQARPKERHLLLLTSTGQRFLCGHDERHWFVAQIGESVSTVRAAKRALMPSTLLGKVSGLRPSKVDNRCNRVFKRQGEWFFIPVGRDFDDAVILRNEPLKRNAGSTPHICEELVRIGGETVYIVDGRAYSFSEYRAKVRRDPRVARRLQRTMVAESGIYVRGCVRHADHATIRLAGWHRVLINTERVTSNVAYLD